MYSGAYDCTMSRFWNTASAVPRYHASSDTRCEAGRMSKLSLRSARMKLQPRTRCRIRLCALYCVATPMRRMPELSAFDNAKSMIRVLPPKYTAGLARRSVSSMSRLPRPPASTNANVSFARRDVNGAGDTSGRPPRRGRDAAAAAGGSDGEDGRGMGCGHGARRRRGLAA